MRLSENQAFQIYEEVCCTASSKRTLTSSQAVKLVWGTSRMQRRVLHLLRRAEKKRAKAERTRRMRNMRPFMRLASSDFEIPQLTLVIRIGNDIELYEPEAVRQEREIAEEWQDHLLASDEVLSWSDSTHEIMSDF